MLYKPSVVKSTLYVTDETVSELKETVSYLKQRLDELDAEVRMLRNVNFTYNYK